MYKRGLEILKVLNNNGYEAYIIGGCPRNKYLGLSFNDIDICTNALPSDVVNLFTPCNSQNAKYGNIIVDNIEITSFRKEKYNNNRYPEVEYVESLEEDLNRRDFLINTLCIDRYENYIDLLNAKEDLNNKIIRVVGDIETKLKEDPIRILRAIRFATILNFKLENNLIIYIKKYGYLLTNLSYSKKKLEIEKIINSENKKIGISLLLEYNLDKYLELYNLDKIDYSKEIMPQIDLNKKYVGGKHD